MKKDELVGGADFEKNAQGAKQVFDRFGDDDLKAFFQEGYGNHPALIRLGHRIRQVISEDSLAMSHESNGAAGNSHEATIGGMYPSMKDLEN